MSKTERDSTAVAGPVEPVVLIRDGDAERKPVLYACPKCGGLFSPRIYACKDEMAHAAAREAAANCYGCRTHSQCSVCGAECDKHVTICPACRRARTIAKARLVPVSEVNECFGLDSLEDYPDPGTAAEDGEEYVYGAVFRPFAMRTDIVDLILDDHHEDAGVSDLVGFDELLAAIAQFNGRQTSGSYDIDRTRIARVADYHGETAEEEQAAKSRPAQPPLRSRAEGAGVSDKDSNDA